MRDEGLASSVESTASGKLTKLIEKEGVYIYILLKLHLMWTETEPNIGLYVTSKHQADPADILRFRLNLFKLPKKYINGSQFVFFVFIALQLIVYFAYLYYSSFILSKIFVR